MNSLRISLIMIILLVPSYGMGFNQSEFDALIADIQNKEYSRVEKFLKQNKNKLSRNPEYYVVMLNYVISKGDKSGLVIAKGTPEEGDLALEDSESGKVVGFMGSRGGYDEALILDGITKTQNALKYFISRLDIHFGIVSIAERIGRWDLVGDQIVNMLEISKQINNQWTWGPIGSMEGEPEEFLIQNILPRTYSMFRANKKEADIALEKVSRSMIKNYPRRIYGYANLGSLYLATNKYDLSEKYFKKALEIDPNDEVVLGNLKKLKELRKMNKESSQ